MSLLRSVALVSLGTIHVALLAGAARAQSTAPQPSMWVADKTVQDLQWLDGTLYVGGEFTRVGPQTGGASPVDLATGALVPGFPVTNGAVYAVEPDGEGGWFVGGDFTTVGGVSRNRIARVRADFTVDPTFDPNAESRVQGLLLVGETLYVHGLFFDDIGGANRKYLAALDTVTGSATAWNPDLNSRPSAMAVLDGVLYVGGNFTTVDGEPRGRLAAFDLATGDLTSWDPGASGEVLAVAAADGVIYAGGRFPEVGGSAQPYLAGLDPTSGDLTPWSPEVSNYVSKIVVADETLYIGGSFSQVGGVVRVAVAEVDRTSGLPTPWDIEWTGVAHDIAIHGDTVFVGGSHNFIEDFLTVQRLHHAAAFDRTTGLRIDWDPVPHDEVFAFEVSDDVLLVAGEFASIGGVDRFFVAGLDGTTGEATDWKPVLSRRAFEVVPSASGDTLFVGGGFNRIDGVERNALAAFETETGALLDWNPDVTGDVREIIVDGSTIFVSGSMSGIGGQFRIGVGAIDRVSGALLPFDAEIDPGSFVNALALTGDTLYVGGSFDMVGTESRVGVAAVNKLTGAPYDWDPAPDRGTEELYVLDHPGFPGGVVFVGGNFDFIGGVFRPGLAAVSRTTGEVFPWNAFLQESFSRAVHTIAVSGNTMFVGGTFSGSRDDRSSNLVAVDVATGDDLPWLPDADGSLRALSLADSTLAAGGFFGSVGGVARSRIAVFSLETEPPLPPGALTATPSATIDRGIDLDWTPSPSADVSGYLIYRSTASIADTTGLRIATTGISSSYADVTPDHGTYHYLVFAVNGSGDVSAPSNEASADSPEISELTVTTAILQNPALSSHVDVTVVSLVGLAEPPSVVIRRDAPEETTDVEMRPIAGSTTSFLGAHVFSDGGTYTIDTDVVPTSGDPASFTRPFIVVLGDPARTVVVPTTDGLATLRVPADAYTGQMVFLSEVLPPADGGHGSGASLAGGPVYRFGPTGPLPGATVEIRYPEPAADPGELAIERLDGGTWVELVSHTHPEEGVVRAATDRAGRFRLVRGRAGSTAPSMFLVGHGRPNPFRTSTSFEITLPENGRVRVEVYDVGGRRVAALLDDHRDAGRHHLAWHGRTDAGTPAAGGVYFLRISAGSWHGTRRMILTR